MTHCDRQEQKRGQKINTLIELEDFEKRMR